MTNSKTRRHPLGFVSGPNKRYFTLSVLDLSEEFDEIQ